MARRLPLLAVVLMAAGTISCGTMYTVPHNNQSIASDLNTHRTYCSGIPRIYSGVAYNFCRLNADPGAANSRSDRGYFWKTRAHPLFDMVPSLVLDTVALPVTCFQQAAWGSVYID